MQEDKILTAVNNMLKTHRLHKHLIEKNVSSMGLSRNAHRALMFISRKDKLFSQKSLAEHIGITPAAITGVLKKLESDGYIKRTQGSDNRFNVVELTDLGKNVVEESFLIFNKTDKSLFEGFSDEELDGYAFLLNKIQDNINKSLSAEETEEE